MSIYRQRRETIEQFRRMATQALQRHPHFARRAARAYKARMLRL